VFLAPKLPSRLGDETSNGLTAGKGNDGTEGTGEADRRIDGDDPKEERRLSENGGGSIGKLIVFGVPGVEGAGEAMGMGLLVDWALLQMSDGAGLLEGIRRAGRSILRNFP
jgi:hypothetical protein